LILAAAKAVNFLSETEGFVYGALNQWSEWVF
jgi:hypothetical protein